MTYSLRPAIKEDSPAISKLVREGKINPTGLDWRRFLLAESADGQVIGCGQIKPHRDGSQELASLVVTGVWRSRGIARALIEALIEEQAGPLYLMCRSNLGPLYERFNFRALDDEEMPKYFRRISKLAAIIEPLRNEGVTLLVMVRD